MSATELNRLMLFGEAVAVYCEKLKLIYDPQSVGQSVLVSGAHLGLVINFSFSLKFLSDSCGFVTL
jgi:Co/Zn/Cd efflux system component